jgi:hypothetical protein
MHDVWPAAAPLDLEQTRAGRGPHFESYTPLRIRTDWASSCRSARNHDLQVAELKEARLDVIFDVPKRRRNHGPERGCEQLDEIL